MTSRDELVEAALGTWWLALGVTPGPSALVSDAMTQRTAEQAMRAVVDVVEADVLRCVRASIETQRERDCPYLGHYKLGYDSALDDALAAVDAAGEKKP